MVHWGGHGETLLSESPGHPAWRAQRFQTNTTRAPSSPVPPPLGLLSGAHGGTADPSPEGQHRKSPSFARPEARKAPQATREAARPHHSPDTHFSSTFSTQVTTGLLKKLKRLAPLKWRRRSGDIFPNFQKELFGIMNPDITNTKGLFLSEDI